MRASPVLAVLSICVAASCACIFVWLHSYVLAAVGTIFVALGLWDLPRHFLPRNDEAAICSVLQRLGGSAPVGVFESALEALADEYGAYSGERLESLHEAVQRLCAKGNLRVEAGVVSALRCVA